MTINRDDSGSQGEAGQGGAGSSRRALLLAGGGLILSVAATAGCAGGLPGALAGGAYPETAPSAGQTARVASVKRGGTGQAGRDRHPGTGVTSQPQEPRPSSWGHQAHPPRSGHRGRGGGHGGAVPGQPEYYLDDGPGVIALTIDDGPSPVYTPQVLAILARYRVTAAFSMVGENVTWYPGVAREVAAAGHEIINHTWDHAYLTGLRPAAMRAEIDRASAAIHTATGVTPRLFRAPYGAWTQAALAHCAAAGLSPLEWSVDPRDWSRPGVAAIVRTIMRTTESGSIILEHDGGGDRAQTVAALKIVIPRLLDAGYRFRTP